MNIAIWALYFFTETHRLFKSTCKAKEGNLVFGARKWLITSLRTSKGDCPSTRKQRAHDGSPLHLSLDHLSLAGHVLVVSPYTSSRIRWYDARGMYCDVRTHVCRLLLLVANAYGAWCRNSRPRCRTGICAPAISRAGFRKEFKEQIDRNLRHTLSLLDRTRPLSIPKLLPGSFWNFLNCSDRIGKILSVIHNWCDIKEWFVFTLTMISQ